MQINVAKLSLYNNFIINFRSFAFRILTVSPVKPFPFTEIIPKIKKQSKKRLCRNLHKQTKAKPFQSFCQQVFLSPASFDSYKAADTGYPARQNSSAYIPQNLYAR